MTIFEDIIQCRAHLDAVERFAEAHQSFFETYPASAIFSHSACILIHGASLAQAKLEFGAEGWEANLSPLEDGALYRKVIGSLHLTLHHLPSVSAEPVVA